MSEIEEEEEEGKFLPANKAEHLCQLWQVSSDLDENQTVCDAAKSKYQQHLTQLQADLIDTKQLFSIAIAGRDPDHAVRCHKWQSCNTRHATLISS